MATIEIPGFEILEKIGAGGMATVWKARQISLDRTVAIKILYSKFGNDPSDVLRFQSEAQSAARLKHHGIVQVYDASTLGGMYYFVMEFVAGYTVGDWLKRSGALPLKDALLVTECVVDALAYAWREAGIIHCDIKPDNILVDADGSVKVSDLGLARTLSQMLSDAASDEIMGTPAYISPEQALGEGTLDFRADVYSLGATLYHMVTGVVPFGGNPPDEIMDMHIRNTIPDPMDLNPKVTAPVAWLIEKMMCKDPAGRHETWEAVARDLDRVKKGLRPLGDALPEGVSTVERSPARLKAVAAGREWWKPQGPSLTRRLVNLAVLLVLAGAGLYALVAANRQSATHQTAVANKDAAGTAPVEQVATATDWSVEWREALEWVTAHPGEDQEAIDRFARIAQGAAGTPYAGMAVARADALRSEALRRVNGVMSELDRRAQPLLAAGKFAEAARIYDDYAGNLAEETREARVARAKDCERRGAAVSAVAAHAPPPAPTAAPIDLDALLSKVTDRVLAGDMEAARLALEVAMNSSDLAEHQDELAEALREVTGVAQAQAALLQSFTRQQGKRVTVELRSGERTLTIKGVENGRIVAEAAAAGDDALAQSTIEFEPGLLSYHERLRRMGGEAGAGESLLRGLLAREARATTAAKRYFDQVSPLIGPRLAAAVERNGSASP